MSALHDYAVALAQRPRATTAPAPRFDEVIGPDGGLRPAWKGMAEAAVGIVPADLTRIGDEITRFIADDGVTYADPGERPRPWRLDPVPLVIDPAGWARIEIGLAQRAELLNALLADFYGGRQLLAEGIVPPEAVLGSPGFLRVVARPSTVDLRPLLIAATDLGRDADGEWRVLGDRTQAPSGLGYAMANRRVMSRVLPELYRDARPHQLEPFFTALRDALLDAAVEGVQDPHVVVLSPGIRSETAWDQASLANLLGFPLVQGEDLVVRGGSVWIKPAGWPNVAPAQRVDVILRRLDADWCDPLELRGDSHLGIAGLAEAARRGTVRLVNGLGTGVLENPALLAFMPAACERLLGEQLRLPSVPAWWCGTAEGEHEVLHRLDERPESLIVGAVDGRPLPAALRGVPAKLADRIRAHPAGYVARERMPLSQAPVWGRASRASGLAAPQPLTLRTFTVRYHEAYRPLLGGLATVAGEATPAVTKDVWIVKASPADPDQGLPMEPIAAVLPSVLPLAPRALEDMYWAGRYAERAEDLLRLVLETLARVVQRRFIAEAGEGSARVLTDALRMLAGTGWNDVDAELGSLVSDTSRPGSVAQSLDRLRDALESVRDQLSGDTWRIFGETDRAMTALREAPHSLPDSANRMLTSILALHGVTANMVRDTGWHAIEAGRFLERAMQLCVLLTAAAETEDVDPEVDRQALASLLIAAESSVTYRRRYRGAVQLQSVLQLLLADHDNPRSLAFSLARVAQHLAALPLSTGSTRPERLLGELAQRLETTTPDSRAGLAGFARDAWSQLLQLSDAIVHLHMAGGPQQQPISAESLTEVTG